tara:strand:+ start:8893 stop:11013 length:2121 start_codon:yes stop_codon:yes gene_type:complete
MKILSTLLYCFITSQLFSQTKPIQGKIIDEKGAPISDANIVSKPSETGTKTNPYGEFIFDIPIKDRLFIIKHIGFEPKKIDAIVFKNGTNISLISKVIELEPLDVTGKSRGQFELFESKNSVTHLETESLAVRGFTDIGDALFSEQSIVMDETLNGQKTISIRASSTAELIYLYDGVRINTLGNPLLDLSLFSASGISGIEIVKGGHEKALSSSGTINFIPKLTYGPSASFTQQFGTYNYGGFDAFGSLGFSRVSVNGGTGQSQYAQAYVDGESAEILTTNYRNFGHLGLKNGHNLEVRLMGFQNGKEFQNNRTGDSIDVMLKTLMGKIIHTIPRSALVSIFGLVQSTVGSETEPGFSIEKNDTLMGIGFSFEKPILNAMLKFYGETNFLKSRWSPNDSVLIMKRQNSVFTGSFELVQAEKKSGIQLKDLKIVLSKHLVNDQSDSIGSIQMDSQLWDEASSMFTTSFLNPQVDKRIMFYTNIGNVFRLPSLSERNFNHIYGDTTSRFGLQPEHKTSYEVGMKIEKKLTDGAPIYGINLSGFSMHYSNKIKQVQLSGSPIQIPMNFGDATISGFDSDFSLTSKTELFKYTSSLAYYLFSDPLAFQLQPDNMFRNKVTLKFKWLQLDVIRRKEGARQVTTIDKNGDYIQNKLIPISTYDANFSIKLILSDYIGTISISGKNLDNVSQTLNGVSIFDKRYTLNLALSWK